MEYVLADSYNSEAYWFKCGIPSLSLALRMAPEFPDAKYIIEYKEDYATKEFLPTGRSWPINTGTTSQQKGGGDEQD